LALTDSEAVELTRTGGERSDR